MSNDQFPHFKPATSQVKGFRDLPIEVISHILEFLPFSYLREARLVCQLWYAASHSPNLLLQEVIVCVQSEGETVSNILRKSHKPVRNICLKGDFHINNSPREGPLLHPDVPREALWNDWVKSYDENFWICYGPKLKSLSFHYCGIIKDELLRILSLCPELKSIEIVGCKLESGILSFCPELKSIDILEPRHQGVAAISDKHLPKLFHLESFTVDGSCGQYLDDKAELFDSIVSSTTRLKTLKLINCMYERGIFGTSYVTPNHVVSYVRKNTHSIVNISFVHKMYQNELALTELLKIPNLQLKCLETNYPIPKELVHRLRSLRTLKLSGHFPDEPSVGVVSELENLKCLELKFCFCECLSHLALLKNLTSLSLGVICMRAEDEEEVDVNALLIKALCSEVNTILKRLSLRLDDSLNVYCDLRAATLIAIARTHPALTDFELDWPSSRSGATGSGAEEDVHLNYAVQAVFKYQVSLQSLRLTNLQELTDSGLNGKRLSSTLEENPTGNSLARLKNLWKLDLADLWAPYIFFENLILPELRDLSLSKFCLPSENVDVFIKNHPLIERLVLNNGQFSDKTIDVIVGSLPRLKYAFIASREKISEESITKLKKHCKTDVSTCGSLVDYY